MRPPPTRLKTEVISLATRVLTPSIGEHMARAAVRAHIDRLGGSGDSLSEEDIDQLLEKLSKGLVVFVGRQVSQRVVAELRAALGSAEKA